MSARQRHRRGSLRRRWAVHQWSLHFGPNMTPMVDVVMVILVFFMASAAFLGPEWMLKSLVPRPPAAGAGKAEPAGPNDAPLPPVRLEITLARDPATGRTLATGVGQTGVVVPDVLDALARFAEGTPKDQIEVLVKPDRDVPYRDVVRVHEGAARTGITRVGVAVTPRTGP